MRGASYRCFPAAMGRTAGADLGEIVRTAVAGWRGGRSSTELRLVYGLTVDVGEFAVQIAPRPLSSPVQSGPAPRSDSPGRCHRTGRRDLREDVRKSDCESRCQVICPEAWSLSPIVAAAAKKCGQRTTEFCGFADDSRPGFLAANTHRMTPSRVNEVSMTHTRAGIGTDGSPLEWPRPAPEGLFHGARHGRVAEQAARPLGGAASARDRAPQDPEPRGPGPNGTLAAAGAGRPGRAGPPRLAPPRGDALTPPGRQRRAGSSRGSRGRARPRTVFRAGRRRAARR